MDWTRCHRCNGRRLCMVGAVLTGFAMLDTQAGGIFTNRAAVRGRGRIAISPRRVGNIRHRDGGAARRRDQGAPEIRREGRAGVGSDS